MNKKLPSWIKVNPHIPYPPCGGRPDKSDDDTLFRHVDLAANGRNIPPKGFSSGSFAIAQDDDQLFWGANKLFIGILLPPCGIRFDKPDNDKLFIK